MQRNEMEKHFGDALAEAVRAKGSAVCVGLDPRWRSLPESIRGDTQPRDWEKVASATEKFCCEVIDAVEDLVPIVKPQAAFFEQLGPHGMTCMARVLRHARSRELLVLLDAKRGDIGTTAEAYAEAYLGEDSPWAADALTVNPYLGADTLEPFVSQAQRTASGIFVLVKTSNPGSRYLQDLPFGRGRVYDMVAETVQTYAAATRGSSGYGIVGAVTGATYPEELGELRGKMPSAWLLIPGYGAQGAGAAEVRGGFDSRGLGAIVNSSRGIIFAYENSKSEEKRWQDSVRRAADEMRAQLPKPT